MIVTSREAKMARLWALVDTIGENPTIELRSGGQPATCEAMPNGLPMAIFDLPAEWMKAEGNALYKTVWPDAPAEITGAMGNFRICDKEGKCHLQGSVSAAGMGGDLVVANNSVREGQTIEIIAFSMTDGN